MSLDLENSCVIPVEYIDRCIRDIKYPLENWIHSSLSMVLSFFFIGFLFLR